MTAADKYYLKAKDNYPYDMEEALEALEYGLSHDEEHAGLLTLKGTIYYQDLKQFEEARSCFELALFYDPYYVEAYYTYIKFALEMGILAKAESLITSAMNVLGINKSRITYYKGALFEEKALYTEAVSSFQAARQYSNCKEEYSFMNNEIERLQLKVKNKKEQASLINIIVT